MKTKGYPRCKSNSTNRYELNVRENRRCNQETLAIMGTKDTRRRQTKQKPQHKKLQRIATQTTTKTGCVQKACAAQNNTCWQF